MDPEVRSPTEKENYSQPILVTHLKLRNFTGKEYIEKNLKEDE